LARALEAIGDSPAVKVCELASVESPPPPQAANPSAAVAIAAVVISLIFISSLSGRG
jgi:hypothetical protein